jgi:hypothetical protein
MLKARENPLRSELVERIPFQPVGWTWDELDERLHRLEFRGAIVGGQGTGKTTLLDALEVRLRQQGMEIYRITLRADHPGITDSQLQHIRSSKTQVILLDGAEQLAPRRWRQVLESTSDVRGLIITSHSPGMLPTLVECRTTSALLDHLLRTVLSSEIVAALEDSPRRLLETHAGNVRLVLRDLYDRLAM